MVSRKIILPELDGRVWLTARPRIGEADRLHRSEPQRILPAMRHHFDRQTALEKFFLVEIMDSGRLGRRERRVEGAILLRRHRTIQIVAGAVIGSAGFRLWALGSRRRIPIPAGGPEHLTHVDRLGKDDRADGVVEVQVLGAHQLHDRLGERFGRQRPGGHDHGIRRRPSRNRRDLFAHERDERVLVNRLRDRARKQLAVDGQRRPGRYARHFGGMHHQRVEPAHLFFQQADGVV